MGFFKDYAKQMTEQGKQNREQLKNLGKALTGQKTVVEQVKGAPFSSIDTSVLSSVSLDDLIKNYEAEQHEFSLQGQKLEISKETDMEVAYIAMYRKAADIFARAFAKESNETIDNIDYWSMEINNIYNKYLRIMADKTVNILIANGVFSETVETVLAVQRQSFVEFDSFYKKSMETINQIKTNVNQQRFNALVGGADTSGNPLAESIVQKLSSMDLDSTDTVGQTKNQIYTKIMQIQDKIFDLVVMDYTNMASTLLYFMKKNGINVEPCVTPESLNQANALFENIQREAFPQDKIPEAVFAILKLNHQDPRYFNFIKQKYGETDEVRRITDYFIS